MDDHAIAKSHRSSIKEIFNYDRESKIVGFNNENELLVRIDSPKEAVKVQGKIKNTQKHAKGVSAITTIKTYTPKSFEFTPKKDEVLTMIIRLMKQSSLHLSIFALFKK